MRHRILTDLAAAQWALPDPGSGAAIRVKQWGLIPIKTGASAETNTLPNPEKEGQLLVLVLKTDGGGDRVVTAAAAVNVAGNTILTFGDAGDTAVLLSVPIGSAFRWKIIANDGVALS